jgi:hypothetical protein
MKSNTQPKAQFILYVFAVSGILTVGYLGISAVAGG